MADDGSILIWGSKNAGKTTYLASIKFAVAQKLDKWELLPVDDRTSDFLNEAHHTLAELLRFPAPTTPVGGGVDKNEYDFQLCFNNKCFGFGKKRYMRFRFLDPAGEFFDMRDLEYQAEYNGLISRQICRAKGLLLLLDPAKEDYYKLLQTNLHKIGRIFQYAQKSGGHIEKLPLHIAICVTKMDKNRDLLDNPDALVETILGIDARSVINSYFHEENVKLFACSSVGFLPNGVPNIAKNSDNVDVLREKPRPVNVLKPIKWLMDNCGDFAPPPGLEENVDAICRQKLAELKKRPGGETVFPPPPPPDGGGGGGGVVLPPPPDDGGEKETPKEGPVVTHVTEPGGDPLASPPREPGAGGTPGAGRTPGAGSGGWGAQQTASSADRNAGEGPLSGKSSPGVKKQPTPQDLSSGPEQDRKGQAGSVPGPEMKAEGKDPGTPAPSASGGGQAKTPTVQSAGTSRMQHKKRLTVTRKAAGGGTPGANPPASNGQSPSLSKKVQDAPPHQEASGRKTQLVSKISPDAIQDDDDF